MSNFFKEQGTSLLANGYRIIPIKQGKKYPAISGWQNAVLGMSDIDRFSNYGVGVLTGQGDNPIVALDIDTTDRKLVDRFVGWCQENLGFTAERVGNAPKILLVYRSAACDKITGKWFSTTWVQEKNRWYSEGVVYKDGKASHKTAPHRLEILGTGQQFVAYHIHPDTGKPYEWVDFVGGLECFNVDVLPVVTHDQLIQAVTEFERLAEELGLQPMPQSTVKSPDTPKVRNKIADDDFFGRVNQEAIENLDHWVPILFPNAREYNGGFRVSSADLNRDLEEDLSLLPQGIVDFGVADIGDAKEGKRTPIDVVLEWGVACFDEPLDAPVTPLEAALWLCECLNIPKEDLGFGLKATREKVGQRMKQRKQFEDIKEKIQSCADAQVLVDVLAKEVGSIVKGNIALEAVASSLIKDTFKRLTQGAAVLSAKALQLAMYGTKKQTPALRDSRHQNTEFGNADRLLDDHGDRLMYVKEFSNWYIWNSTYWESSNNVEIEHLAKETVRALPSEARGIDSDAERADFLNFCALSQKDKMLKSMIWLAKSDPKVAISVNELDKDNLQLGCANGVVDLNTGDLLEPNPLYRVTYSTNVNYDPKAVCPVFKQTILDVFNGCHEMVAFFQRLMGYVALGNPCEQLIIIPYGSGANGKSTVIGAIQNALGGYTRSAASETFLNEGRRGNNAGGAREDLLRLRGARFVYVNEPNEGAELKEDLIKATTGGEKISARGLYATRTVEFYPTWTVVMPTNHKPVIKGDDHGIWRRILLIPFTRNFDKDPTAIKDPQRPAKLLLELPGILRWLVEGALAYRKEGLNPPEIVKQAREDYKKDMDIIAEWLETECVLDERFACTNTDLFNSWMAYAAPKGLSKYLSSSQRLANKMESRGFKRIRDTKGIRGRGFLGIGIKQSADFADLSG